MLFMHLFHFLSRVCIYVQVSLLRWLHACIYLVTHLVTFQVTIWTILNDNALNWQVLIFCFSAVISPASWREGQKLVKMVLGPVSKLPREDRPRQADGLSRTGGKERPTLNSSIHTTAALSRIIMLVIFMIPRAILAIYNAVVTISPIVFLHHLTHSY